MTALTKTSGIDEKQDKIHKHQEENQIREYLLFHPIYVQQEIPSSLWLPYHLKLFRLGKDKKQRIDQGKRIKDIASTLRNKLFYKQKYA